MSVTRPMLRLHLALMVISAAVVAYQLALMQILSLVQWHHFASMIIAVALLGFGAAGTCLTLLRSWLMRHFPFLLPIALCLAGAAMAQIPDIAQSEAVRFDSLLLFTGITQFLRLLFAYGLTFLPFFFAALAIGMIFLRGAGDIGRLYFWNLAGSGAGGMAMVILFSVAEPPALPGIIALAALAASLLVLPEGLRRPFYPQRGTDEAYLPSPSDRTAAKGYSGPRAWHIPGDRRHILMAVAILTGLAVLVPLIHPPVLILSEFKGLSKALLLPDARITYQQNSPYGYIQVVSSPALRYAPGLSLAYQGAIPVTSAVFNNGEWFGPLMPVQGKDSEVLLDFTTGALPYALGTPRRILLLDAGTGSLIPQALHRGVERIIAVESHPVILSLLEKERAGETGPLLSYPSVEIRCLSSRTFLLLDTSQYDLIVLPTVDVFGGASGLHALREQYLFTREAFRQIWRKLSSRGVVSVTCWMDYPLRHSLKILSTMAEALEEEGIGNIRVHLAAVRGWGTITFIAKKSPLLAGDTEKIRDFCRRLLFDPLLLPDLRTEERAQFNGLQDGRLFASVDAILSPSRERFIADYPFNIRPATDNSPYFSQFLRWGSIPDLAGLYGARTVPFLEVGYLLVLLTLIQVIVAALVLIVLPLRLLRREGGYRMSTFFYFSGLGIGYMFVEIVLIQRFLLYFGNPLHAAAMVMSGMLICSGIGSLLSVRWIRTGTQALIVLMLIVFFILITAFFLDDALLTTIAQPPAVKFILSFLFIAPAALVMGMPFPLGIRLLAGTADQEIAWAWGINGCFSVVSTVLAAVIAVERGFVWVMILAALAYAMTFIGGLAGLFRPEAFRKCS